MSVPHRRRFLQAGAAVAAGLVTGGLTPPARLEAAGDKAPKFRLGIVTYNIAKDWDVPTLLKVCKSVGLSPVELRTTHKHGVEPTLSKEERQEVRKRFADAGVEIWGCGSVCEFHSPDPAVVKKNIETCKEFVHLAADVDGKGVKVRPNGLPKDVPIEKTLEQIGKALIECGKAAADAGVEIWVEVHGGGPADPRGSAHPPYCKRMMEHCGLKNVGLTWNSNPGDIKDKSVEEYFRLLRPWIKSCHINELYKDSTGAYPYRELFRLFRETGYDRVTLCEVGKSPPDPATGEDVLRYYKALWTELARG
ncbi:MAG TPA: sugar phosphate isomerase/epimerase family protein [Gemmataceae bacterium]|nr:sugar phosphate isomerase/epimerase family protein [Gemmataceae bacterium]